MARRAKPAAEPVRSLAPPPSAHPPGGYDARTVAEAAEIMRHQSHVLEVRVREEELAGRDAAQRTETAKARMHERGVDTARAALEATARSLEEREEALADAEASADDAQQQAAAALAIAQASLDQATTAERENTELRARLRAELEEVANRANELDARENALAVAASALEERESRLEKERAKLGAQSASLADREQAVAADAADLRLQAKEHKRLSGEFAKLQAQAVRIQRDLLPEPTPETAAQSQVIAQQPVGLPPDGTARFNIETLSSLVDHRGGEFPDRVDEWRWTISSLRDIADISGTLPYTVDGLVRDVFEPILS